MKRASQKILTDALDLMLEKIHAVIEKHGYHGEPVKMILAGGMAMNYYCGTRYTADVDATFSVRILLPYEELLIPYQKDDGSPSFIYLDANYSPALSLMHEDYADELVEHSELNHKGRLVQLFLLSPIDLAISKISRFSDQDVEDILELARNNFFTADQFRARATDALAGYIGNIESVRNSINILSEKMQAIECEQNDFRH